MTILCTYLVHIYILRVLYKYDRNAGQRTRHIHSHSVYVPNNSATGWRMSIRTRRYTTILAMPPIGTKRTRRKKKQKKAHTHLLSCSDSVWLCISYSIVFTSHRRHRSPENRKRNERLPVHLMWLYYALRFRQCSRSPYRLPWDITFNVMSKLWQPWARPFWDRKYAQQGHLRFAEWAPSFLYEYCQYRYREWCVTRGMDAWTFIFLRAFLTGF